MDPISYLRDTLHKLNDESYEQARKEVIAIVKREDEFRTMEQTMQFHVGDKVQFESGRHGDVWTGKVQSVNRKTVTVEATSKPLFGEPETKLWRVSPGYLRKVK
jgi:hypothetical protein